MLLLFAGCSTAPIDPSAPNTPPETEISTSGALTFVGPRPRNLLMISIDTLRRDHVDRYASDGVTRMDFLSGLLAEGVALDNHTQCSNWTYHSTSCTLLGRQVEEIGWVAKLNGNGPTPVPNNQQMLAVRLESAGFRSLLASTISWLSDEWNNAQGYEDDLTSGVTDTIGVARTALDGLQAVRSADPRQRWFLHMHLVEPHAPYSPPDGYRDEIDALPPISFDLDDHEVHYDAGEAWPEMTPEEQELLELHLRTRYTAETRWLDDQLATVWSELDSAGVLDDTLVVFWNDHGEAFWEHGVQTHAHTLNTEETDAILGFWAKNLQPLAWTGPTSAIDMVPTVLSALGLPLPSDGTLPGSVVGDAPPDRPQFSSTSARDGSIASVTVEGLKLTFNFDGTLKLYDRNVDPQERVDLYTPGDLRVAPLWATLEPRVQLLSLAAPEVPLTLP